MQGPDGAYCRLHRRHAHVLQVRHHNGSCARLMLRCAMQVIIESFCEALHQLHLHQVAKLATLPKGPLSNRAYKVLQYCMAVLYCGSSTVLKPPALCITGLTRCWTPVYLLQVYQPSPQPGWVEPSIAVVGLRLPALEFRDSAPDHQQHPSTYDVAQYCCAGCAR